MKKNDGRSISSGWQTPQDLFDVLDKGGEFQGIPFEGFNFDIDLCATRKNTKCEHFCHDYLKSITGSIDSNCTGTLYEDFDYRVIKKSAFMNPPYSNPLPFIQKAWEDSKYCKIVCLVKVDTSTKWWKVFWNYSDVEIVSNCSQCYGNGVCEACWGTNRETYIQHRGAKPGCDVIFLPKRVKFDPPQELIDTKEVFKIGGKLGYNKQWVQKCKACVQGENFWVLDNATPVGKCNKCKGKGYTPLSGPSFASAILIFDRRNTYG